MPQLFSQTLGQFATSKTNILGLVIMLSGIIALATGANDLETGMAAITFGGSLLTVRDAIAKVEQK